MTDFQYILLSDCYDALANPLKISAPWKQNICDSRKIGARWRHLELGITKFNGFPEHARATMDSIPLPDYSGVVVVELEQAADSAANNAVIYNADGSERVRLQSPLGSFLYVGYENGELGFAVVDGEWERWYSFDHQTYQFGKSHPLR